MNQNLIDLRGKYEAKIKESKSYLTIMRDATKSSEDVQKAHEQFDTLEKELTAIKRNIDAEVISDKRDDEEAALKTAGNLPGMERGTPDEMYGSIGEAFTNLDSYKEVKDWRTLKERVFEVKSWQHPSIKSYGRKTAGADITIANVPQPYQQIMGIVPSPLFPVTIMDKMTTFPQTQNSWTYFQETEVENNAGTQSAEVTALVKSGFKTSRKTITAEPIGTYFRVAETQLADQPNLRSYMDQRIILFVNIEAERQILTGNGSGELTGLYNTSACGTYARGTNQDSNGNDETNLDAIYRGLTDVRINGVANPSIIVVHPNNLKTITLIKDANDNYIFRKPAEAMPPMMWGVPFLETPRATSGTALIADLNAFVRLGIMSGMNVVLERNGTDLIDMAFTLRAFTRMSLEVTRVLAIETVTALN